MRILNYISADPVICHGKPCFKGTRITVSTILELLESNTPYEEIHKGYPRITPTHIKAALHFAHHLVDQGRFVPLREPADAVSR
jgi:uncharacterized protein (DUF433 family)